ncbi:hypothetical protein Tco_0553008 [Tanacetum coccineum]
MLKVPPWKRVIRFGKRGNLNPRYIEPFEVAAKVRTVTYRLELPQQLSRVHSIFHVSNLKTCLSDESLAISLDVIQIDDKLHFVEEPVEVYDREVKRLKQSRIPIVRVDGPLEEVQSSRRNVKKNFKTSPIFTERVNAVRIKEVMYEKFNGPPFTGNASRNKQGVPGFYTKNENMLGKDEGVTPLEKYLLKFIEEFTKKQDELDELVEKSDASIKIEINNIEASLKRLDDRVDQLIKVVKHGRYRTSTINLGKNYITNNISSIGVSFVEQVSQD